MIIDQTDKPLYTSTKDETLTNDGEDLLMQAEPVEMEIIKPQLKTVTEPEKTVDTGNGIYSLKPSVPIKVLNDKKYYIDIEKLLKEYTDIEAEKIVADLTNNDLSDDILQNLILKGIVTDTQPVKAVKKNSLLNNITNFLYNLIYN